MTHLIIDLHAEDANRPHWLNVEARYNAALLQLRVIQDKIASLLSKPPHVLIDPYWATTTTGDFLHHAFDDAVRCIERHSERQIALPKRERWDLSDTGGGITRAQLRELAAHIGIVRDSYLMP